MNTRVLLTVFISLLSLHISSFELLAQQVQGDDLRLGDDAGFTIARNAVFFELFGTTIAYSINYERYFDPIRLRIGIEPFRGPAIPILLNYYFDRDRIELGAGVIWLPRRHFPYTPILSQDKSILWTVAMGYRYQQREGGFVFRATWTLLFEKKTFPDFFQSGGSIPIVPWFGLSAGYAF